MRAVIEVNEHGRVVRRTVRARDRAHAEEQARVIAGVEATRGMDLGEAVLRHLQDPEMIEARITSRAKALEEYIERHGEKPFRCASTNGWTLLVSRDPSIPGQWRVTRFEGEEPVGHTEARDFRSAVATCRDYGGDLP